MATSSFGSSTAAHDARAARKRVSAALAVSLLLHLVIAGLIRGGSTTFSHRASVQNFLHARISELAAPTLPDAPPAALELNHARSPPRREHASDSPPAIAESAAAGRASNAITAARTADAKYYSARELDVYPAPLAPLMLNHTGKAAAGRSYGYALLAIMLDATGAVADVELLEVQPAGYFDDDAVKAITSTRFTPALRNGRAVKTRIVVRIDHGAQSDR
jgi:protein TonB